MPSDVWERLDDAMQELDEVMAELEGEIERDLDPLEAYVGGLRHRVRVCRANVAGAKVAGAPALALIKGGRDDG